MDKLNYYTFVQFLIVFPIIMLANHLLNNYLFSKDQFVPWSDSIITSLIVTFVVLLFQRKEIKQLGQKLGIEINNVDSSPEMIKRSITSSINKTELINILENMDIAQYYNFQINGKAVLAKPKFPFFNKRFHKLKFNWQAKNSVENIIEIQAVPGKIDSLNTQMRRADNLDYFHKVIDCINKNL